MSFLPLQENTACLADKSCAAKLQTFRDLLQALQDQALPEPLVASINEKITGINAVTASGDSPKALLKKHQTTILNQLEKELKLVPKGHFKKKMMVVGMAGFGIPFGVIFGTVLKNMAFLGLGLPIGMAIGTAQGTILDEKAKKEGRQLNVEIKG